MEIKEILERLLGKIEPVGETNEDNKRFENLDRYREVLNFIIDRLLICANYKNDNRYSVNRIGEEAFEILKDIDFVQEQLEIIELEEE